MKTHLLVMLLAGLLLTGCSAVLPYLVAAGQVAQWISAVLDTAEAGADAHFERHPSPELEAKVDAAIAKTRGALAALDSAVLAAESSHDGDVEAARQHLLDCYDELYRLLEGSGLLSQTGLLGAPGETLDLPHPSEVEARSR